MELETTAGLVVDLAEQRRRADRLQALNLVAAVVNQVKPVACTGLLKLTQGGAIDPLQENYLRWCSRRVPDLGVIVTLTRDFSPSLAKHLRCGHMLHLSLVPLAQSALLDFAGKNPGFRQLAELDDSSAADWVVTAFAPFELYTWEDRKPDGTRSYRLFCRPDFSAHRVLWANQQREIQQVCGWRKWTKHDPGTVLAWQDPDEVKRAESVIAGRT